MTPETGFALAIGIAIVLAIGALPVAIAALRRHPDLKTIAKLAPLALFSFVLWFALIAWAASDKRNDGVVSRAIEKVRERNLGPWIVGGLFLLGLLGTASAMQLG